MNRHGDRGSRKRKRKKAPRIARQSAKAETKYGPIPLVEKAITNAYGKVIRYYEYDFDFKPCLPAGAIRGNPRLQRFCPLHNVPRYYYEDERRECKQCGQGFTFSAREQKYWYEGLQFHFNSDAIRCRECRRKRRTESVLRAQMSSALARLRANPSDPDALLSDAEAIIRYHQRTGQGNLDRAISSARKAIDLWPKAKEARFWEGMAQHRAGRADKARAALVEYIQNVVTSRKRRNRLLEEAKSILEATG